MNEKRMNFNTIKQELNKKIKFMSEKDFNNFIMELKRIYYKTHRRYYLKGYEDAEKEHNYHLKKIRAEIANEEQKRGEQWALGLRYAVKIIDKYMAESEDKG